MRIHRFASLVAGSAFLFAGAAPAGDYSLPKVVDGIEIHLGIVPASVALKDPVVSRHGNKSHGSHHLLVALTDPTNGARLDGEERQLDPLTMSPSKVSFGNFFLMNGLGPFQIILRIRRSPEAAPIEARFDYP